MDPASVAARWGSQLPPGQVHVVVAPRVRSTPTTLWGHFAEACLLDDDGLDLDVHPANESLGVRAAEVLRKVNEQDHGPIRGAREQSKWLRDTLAHGVLAELDDEPMQIADDQLADAERQADDAIERIRSAGWRVHGNLEDIRATRQQGRMPGEVPAEELLDVATGAIVALLLELRDAHSRSDPQRAEPPKGVGLLDLRGRKATALFDELDGRLDAIEHDIQESRRLHERVASLSDLVSELLLPAYDQDVPTLQQALRDYRDTSL